MYLITKAFIFGCCFSLLGLFCFLFAPGYDVEENFGLNLLFSIRGERTAPNNIVIIAIDKIASDYYGLPNIPSKWPRELHAQLIRYLQSKQVAVIAMDIFFKKAKNQFTDQQLANAIKRANNVVLFAQIKRELLNEFGTTPRTSSSELFNIERIINPTPVIASAAQALAPFALPKYPAKVSTFWLFRVPTGEIATMPVVVLQLYLFKQKSFNDNLRILEKQTRVKFPVITTNQGGNDLNIAKFISEMKDWSQKYQNLISELTNQLQAGFYESQFSNQEVISLLQFLNLYSDKNIRYLNFIGPPRTIKTYSFDMVLNEQLPADFSLKNKIVFVGFSERLQPEQSDNFNTVYSQKNGVDLSGVEIAATAFSNLYNRDTIATINHDEYLLLVAIFGFVVAFLARYLSNIISISVLALLSFSYFGLCVFMFSTFNVWLPIIIPVFILMPISLFIAISWQYLETNKERNLIRKAFGFYLPDDVVNELATKKRSVQNSQNLMYGVCMATDAEQYTSLSENLKPNYLSTLINKYYEILFKPVRDYKGIISDVIGDAMLAIWTAHIPELKLRKNACYSSLIIQQELNKLQYKNKDYALSTRIGLHSGTITMGNVGAIDHFEYRAVGDIVNTTNRIQGLNKYLKTKIIASHEAIHNIPDLVSRELGQFKLAGKKNTLELYEIISFKSSSTKHENLILLFSTALQSFYRGDLQFALKQYSEILVSYPDDGPSQFYINHIKTLMNSDDYVNTKWTATICMDKK